MKIVPIFATRLFAFHYEGEEDNEYDRLLDLWEDMEYVYRFLKENKSDLPRQFNLEILAGKIIEDAEAIDDRFLEIVGSEHETLDHFFKPLHNQEYQLRILSLQKGRKSYLRIYAIKIDHDCYVITGGAIKFHHLMEGRAHTKHELQKLSFAHDYLKANGIFDEASFFEFLNED